jgi:hypothetical protein
MNYVQKCRKKSKFETFEVFSKVFRLTLHFWNMLEVVYEKWCTFAF